ncbi:MAG: hypothetical protein ACYSSI_01915 [Planctomycetota bacterium]|jgi:hypothetical protein
MKKLTILYVLSMLFWAGCDGVRFAPTEVQKQNAWLHNGTASIAAQNARVEEASEKLQDLTNLSELQSRAFTSYFGLPKSYPPADTAKEILTQSNFTLAASALQQSVERPNLFDLADNTLELAIGISALLGGVYGTKFIWFLKQARTKSKALREIIEGNELFKKEHTEIAADFKRAHKSQSSPTRQLVAEIKT